MMLPGLFLLFFINYLPLILGAPIAFMRYEFVADSTFVGVQNFSSILYDTRFWDSIWKTFYYAILVVGLGFWPPILLAIMLDEVPTNTLKYIYRTIFYLPTIVSGIIMVFLWKQLYNPSEDGFLNQIIMSVNTFGPVAATVVKLILITFWLSLVGFVIYCFFKLKELSIPVRGAILAFACALIVVTVSPFIDAWIGPSDLIIEARNLVKSEVSGWSGLLAFLTNFYGTFDVKAFGWVSDASFAMFGCVLPMVWAGAGPGCIIYLAALKTVPEDLVEAATIDGASFIQKISYITLPRVKLLILIQLMGAIVGALRGGTNFIIAMTNGGPNGATRTLGMDIFERAFTELEYGVGSAMGWILGGIMIVISCYQMIRMSQSKFRTADQAEREKNDNKQ